MQFFGHGDVLREWMIKAMPGVTYGVYGTGKKTEFLGHTEKLANSELCELYDEKCHIWKHTKKVASP